MTAQIRGLRNCAAEVEAFVQEICASPRGGASAPETTSDQSQKRASDADRYATTEPSATAQVRLADHLLICRFLILQG